MDERKKVREELAANDAPQLQAHQGRVPSWDLPQGYLDQLTAKVLKEANTPTRYYRRLTIVRWAAAAVVVLALGAWYIMSPANNQPLTEVDLSTIPTADLQQYVSDNIDEFDLDLLASTVAEVPSSNSESPTMGSEGISTEALERYLEADEEWLEDLEADEDWF